MLEVKYGKWGLLLFYISLGWFVVFYIFYQLITALEQYLIGFEAGDLAALRSIASILMYIYALGVLSFPISLLLDYFKSREEQKEEKREKVLKTAREIIHEVKKYLGEEE